jgi:hypothetical protein
MVRLGSALVGHFGFFGETISLASVLLWIYASVRFVSDKERMEPC